jgi:hypothetical protein
MQALSVTDSRASPGAASETERENEGALAKLRASRKLVVQRTGTKRELERMGIEEGRRCTRGGGKECEAREKKRARNGDW